MFTIATVPTILFGSAFGFGRNFCEAIVLDLGDVEVAVGVDVDLMDAVELAWQRAVARDNSE